MLLTDKQGKSWICKRCNFEMVEIQKNAVAEIIETFNPKFRSLPTNWNSIQGDWIQICPRCDKYPLGFETEQGFPIRTKSGDITIIHNLPFVKAHQHTEFQQEILSSEIAGCFYCCQTFSPSEIIDWHGEDCKEYEPLAICPLCRIDSVIGSGSGFPIEPTFLSVMHDFWFSPDEWGKTVGATEVG